MNLIFAREHKQLKNSTLCTVKKMVIRNKKKKERGFGVPKGRITKIKIKSEVHIIKHKPMFSTSTLLGTKIIL